MLPVSVMNTIFADNTSTNSEGSLLARRATEIVSNDPEHPPDNLRVFWQKPRMGSFGPLYYTLANLAAVECFSGF